MQRRKLIKQFNIYVNSFKFISIYRSGKDGRKGAPPRQSPRGSTSSLPQQRIDRTQHAEKANSLPMQRANRAQDRNVQGRHVQGHVASEVGAQGKLYMSYCIL